MRTGATAKSLLDAELKQRNLSVRGLAKTMAENGGEMENHRRALNRILKGGKPEDQTADAIEAALGMPSGWLPRFDPRRQSESDAAEMAALRASLETLKRTVASLKRTVGSHEKRIAVLEQALPGEEPGTPQEAAGP